MSYGAWNHEHWRKCLIRVVLGLSRIFGWREIRGLSLGLVSILIGVLRIVFRSREIFRGGRDFGNPENLWGRRERDRGVDVTRTLGILCPEECTRLVEHRIQYLDMIRRYLEDRQFSLRVFSEARSFFGRICLRYAQVSTSFMQAALLRFVSYSVGVQAWQCYDFVLTDISVDSLYAHYNVPILYRIAHAVQVPRIQYNIILLPLSALSSPTSTERRFMTLVINEPTRWFPVYYASYAVDYRDVWVRQQLFDVICTVFGI
jgi:hypothetical protein